MLHKTGGNAWRFKGCREVYWAWSDLHQGLYSEGCGSVFHERIWKGFGNISGRVETWCKQPGIAWRGSKVHIILVKIPAMCLIFPVSFFGCKSCLTMYIHFSCVKQINRTSRGDVTPEELKERQVCHIVWKSLQLEIIIRREMLMGAPVGTG